MNYSKLIQANAQLIRDLRASIQETFRTRKTPEGGDAWKRACAEFHATYDTLAFPGGYETALDRIIQEDAEAIEAAIVFLELRPYFFRSGYMRKKLLRRMKHATLTPNQAKRFAAVVDAERTWRAEFRAKPTK